MLKPRTKIKTSPDKAIARLQKLAEGLSGPNTVKVGLPQGTNAYPDGTDTVMVGAVHEFGSPSRGIPQRSYLRTTLNEKRRAYFNLFKKLSKRIVKGEISKLEALAIVGQIVQNDVQSKIEEIKSPPLVDREGNPLIDTGHLRQSIRFEVEE